MEYEDDDGTISTTTKNINTHKHSHIPSWWSLAGRLVFFWFSFGFLLKIQDFQNNNIGVTGYWLLVCFHSFLYSEIFFYFYFFLYTYDFGEWKTTSNQ
jgi:hypothetical protein